MFEQQFRLKISPQGLGPQAARHYETAVRSDLLKIYSSAAGKILFRGIRHWSITIPIIPSSGDSACDAEVVRDRDEATGIVMPTVRYTPGRYVPEGSCGRAMGGMGLDLRGLGEKALFHELVHAFRTVSKSIGKNYRYAYTHGGLYRYDDTEEVIAIVTTNIYASERDYQLRADHQTAGPPPQELAGSFEFFATSAVAFQVIEKFCKENPWFTKALSEVSAPFNPLTAYYKDSKKALKYSQKRSAIERDADGYDDQVFDTMQRNRKSASTP